MSDAQPSPMKSNLIIPCGTSQLEKLLGEEPALKCSPNTISKVKEAFTGQLEVHPEDYLSKRQVKGAINEIVSNLIAEFKGRHSKVPKPEHVWDNWWAENPFGSELSTLIRLEEELNLGPKKRKEDPPHRFILLASETPAGLMARRVLQRVLTDDQGYKLNLIAPQKEEQDGPQPGVKEELVAGLTEVPNDAVAAEINLVERIRWNLIGMDSGWRNLFLATGGFKSILPCMTMLSLLYGIEMVYLFEHSPQIQRFQLVKAETAQEKEAWREEWKRLRKDGKLKPSGCLETIFSNWNLPDRKKVEPVYG